LRLFLGHMQKIPLNDGRHLFGNDPGTYAQARPDYPDALYERLITRCGLRPGISVFEIGPGTGLATRRLLSLGASPLRAIEPDPRLAIFLRDTIENGSLEIDQWCVQLEGAALDRTQRSQDILSAARKA
jgi:phospholipid N-methyltransferase